MFPVLAPKAWGSHHWFNSIPELSSLHRCGLPTPLSAQGTNNISRVKATIWTIIAPSSTPSPSLGSASFISLRPGTKHLLWIKYLARLGHRDLKPCSLPSGNSPSTVRNRQESVTIPCGKVQCELSEQPATGRRRCPQTGKAERGYPRGTLNGGLTRWDRQEGRHRESCVEGQRWGESWKGRCRLVEVGTHTRLICLDFRL